MPAGDHYFRALYIDSDKIQDILHAHTAPELVDALDKLDNGFVYLDIKSIKIDLIRFLTEYIVSVEKIIRANPNLTNVHNQMDFNRNFVCYVALDDCVFRIALRLQFKLFRDRPRDYSAFEIDGDIRLIPKDPKNAADLIRYIDTTCSLLLHDWTMLQFSRSNNGVCAITYYNVAKSCLHERGTIAWPLDAETCLLEIFHGFILSLLAPMAIFCLNGLSVEQYACYGYKDKNTLYCDDDVSRPELTDVFTLANVNGINFQYCLTPARLADIKNKFVHSLSGQPAEVISRDEAPPRCSIC